MRCELRAAKVIVLRERADKNPARGMFLARSQPCLI